MNATQAIAALTPKGRATMTAVGRGQTSFFDEGIVEDSGIWGECLVNELGHRSSGVINQLAKLGLFAVSSWGEPDGAWFALTALGADVANELGKG